MKIDKVSIAVLATYLMATIVVLVSTLSIWQRAHDSLWAGIENVRWQYDAMSVALACLAVAAAVGLWYRREWGRAAGLSLAGVVLFYCAGFRLAVVFLLGFQTSLVPGAEEIALGVLALACLLMLNRISFNSDGNDLGTYGSRSSSDAGK